ncbi:hypothetical protein ACHWQZ_G004985 [Mnemiopsis leidyi]
MANRGPAYGMSKEVQDKIEAQYDTELEVQCREWIGAVVGDKFPEGSFHEALKDGALLCRLMNVLSPGSIPKVHSSKFAFKAMENINFFLTAATEKLGVPAVELFQTVDLFEATNMTQVLWGLTAVARYARKANKDLPSLGPDLSAENKRNFDSETLNKGASIVGMQAGGFKGANQEGMIFGRPRAL